jgi:hypothetical protein
LKQVFDYSFFTTNRFSWDDLEEPYPTSREGSQVTLGVLSCHLPLCPGYTTQVNVKGAEGK